MKKIVTYIFMIALTAVIFTACGSKQNDMTADTATNAPTDKTTDSTANQNSQDSKPQNSDTIISEDEAKGIALKDANLKDSEISKFRIKLERDDGIQKYDIDFNSGKHEYDYEIDATSGKILEKDEEPID